jgi:predicted aspartyl protease
LAFAIPLFLVLLGRPAVAADSCPPLKIVTSVAMEPGHDDRPYVPVKIDGHPEYMLIDTGSSFTGVTETISSDLRLDKRHSRVQFVGVGGRESNVVAHGALTLGNLYSDGMDLMMIEPMRKLPNGANVAGLLGGNLLRAYDLELDFGKGKANLLSQDHCTGKVVYWPNNQIAVVPMQINSSGHIVVPVDIDGHRLTALLDTGANVSVLNLEAAEGTFGIKPGAPDTPAVGELGNASGMQIYSHRFKSLSLEGVAVINPDMTVIPDLLRTKLRNPHQSLEGDTRIPNPNDETGMSDVILGTDILHHLHIYIAYKERNLYITAAEAPKGTAALTNRPSINSTAAFAMATAKPPPRIADR